MTTKPTGPVPQDGAASHSSDLSAALDVEISGALLALPAEDSTQPPALRQALRGTAEALQAMRVALVLTDADGIVRELSAALDCLPWPTSEQTPELYSALTLTRGHLRTCKDLVTSRLLESAPAGSHFGSDQARPARRPGPVPAVPPLTRPVWPGVPSGILNQIAHAEVALAHAVDALEHACNGVQDLALVPPQLAGLIERLAGRAVEVNKLRSATLADSLSLAPLNRAGLLDVDTKGDA